MESLYARFEGYDKLKGLLDACDEEVLLRLGKPTLIRIPGTMPTPRARMISCLLHGNEDSGYRATLELLRSGALFPFDLWVFIGNVAAASRDGWFGHRYLDGQEDFNRVWGRGEPWTPTRQMAAAIVGELAEADLEAGIDLHNTSGKNPYHAVIAQPTDPALALATTCANIVLDWRLRGYLLMEELSFRCPAAVVECGLAGRSESTAFATGVVHRFLSAPSFQRPTSKNSTLLVIAYCVSVRPQVRFRFANELADDLDLALLPHLEGHNFGMLLAGSELGQVRPGTPMPLQAVDMAGNPATERLFDIRPDGRLVVAEDVTPLMMAKTELQARQDCLFYIARHRAS